MGTAVLSREEECRSVSIFPPPGHTSASFRGGESRRAGGCHGAPAAPPQGLKREESESELQDEQVPLGRRLLNGWMAVAGRFGSVQTLLLLVFSYPVLIGRGSLLR